VVDYYGMDESDYDYSVHRLDSLLGIPTCYLCEMEIDLNINDMCEFVESREEYTEPEHFWLCPECGQEEVI